MDKTSVVVSGRFDNPRLAEVRLLEEAAKLGPVHVLLWPDQPEGDQGGPTPRFPAAERLYFISAIRFVDRVTVCESPITADALPERDRRQARAWVVAEDDDHPRKQAFCRQHALQYHVVRREALASDPQKSEILPQPSARKRVVVTGCYDWLHSGHVRFFEEASALGDLYVVVGNDANLRLLKGDGHPMFPEAQRRYLVSAIGCVTQALISTGEGWLDAEPEIRQIRPDIYVVNEDGDRGGKDAFCQVRGIEYRVLKRLPKSGLPARRSRELRG